MIRPTAKITVVSLLSISIVISLILIINIAHFSPVKSTENTPPTPTKPQEIEDIKPAAPNNEDNHVGENKNAEPTTRESLAALPSKNNKSRIEKSPVTTTDKQYSTDISSSQSIDNNTEQEERIKNTAPTAATIINTYPNADSCPQTNSLSYEASACESISYVSWKIKERYGKTANEFGISGDAKNWGQSAAVSGLRVDNIPEQYSVGYSSTSNVFPFGHVIWVESVNADGTINLSEYDNPYSSISGQKGDFGYRTNVLASSFTGYIHFD